MWRCQSCTLWSSDLGTDALFNSASWLCTFWYSSKSTVPCFVRSWLARFSQFSVSVLFCKASISFSNHWCLSSVCHGMSSLPWKSTCAFNQKAFAQAAAYVKHCSFCNYELWCLDIGVLTFIHSFSLALLCEEVYQLDLLLQVCDLCLELDDCLLLRIQLGLQLLYLCFQSCVQGLQVCVLRPEIEITDC